MKPDEFKSLIKEIGSLIDMRAKTTETLIKAEMKGLHKRIDETKEELTAEILAARAEAKTDNLTLASKLVKKVNSHERRMDAADIPNPEKH